MSLIEAKLNNDGPLMTELSINRLTEVAGTRSITFVLGAYHVMAEHGHVRIAIHQLDAGHLRRVGTMIGLFANLPRQGVFIAAGDLVESDNTLAGWRSLSGDCSDEELYIELLPLSWMEGLGRYRSEIRFRRLKVIAALRNVLKT
jgi:hypothetical protein